ATARWVPTTRPPARSGSDGAGKPSRCSTARHGFGDVHPALPGGHL
ncbi:MAG: hypothetical protein AVDCRST_MAG93-3620, partial [uncultured Chloroflexia bacterium]